MSRSVVLAALVLVAGACAGGPAEAPAPEEAILGAWTCATEGALSMQGQFAYKPEGVTDFKADLKTVRGGVTMELSGEGQASWAFLEPAADAPADAPLQLQQTMTAIKVTSAKANGEPFDVALAQQLAGGMLLNQTSVFAATVAPDSLVLKAAEDDATTTCTR